jgi:hypothetical protein
MMRKDLLVAVLATFCLTASLFMIRASTGGYDPWLDSNDDGYINAKDAVLLGGAFGTMGDPAKNVTIAGRVNKLAYTIQTTLSASSLWYTGEISVDGYSKLTVCLYYSSVVNYYALLTRHDGGTWFYADRLYNFTTYVVKTYDVPNENINIRINNFDAVERDLYIDVYLIP